MRPLALAPYTGEMEPILAYFRQAVREPLSVPPWSEWWAANAELAEAVLPLFDFVRVKHRRLLGARQMLQIAGELPRDWVPPPALETGSCPQCGERVECSDAATRCPGCGAAEAVTPA